MISVFCKYGILKDGVTFNGSEIKDGDERYSTDLGDPSNLMKIENYL